MQNIDSNILRNLIKEANIIKITKKLQNKETQELILYKVEETLKKRFRMIIKINE